MTPAQEVCNAATMLLPSLALFLYCQPSRRTHADLILLGTCMHLPSSVAYHLQCALDPKRDRIDNDLRRLDQSMQHAVAPMFAYALSHGSWAFAACNVPLNAYGIARLWDQSTSNDGRRWRLVALSMLLYAAPPMALRWRRQEEDWHNGALAAASAALGGFLFANSAGPSLCQGWGHSGFHVCMAGFGLALARSSSASSQV